jgi:O-antigen/teichoic acid export membrane protein
MIVIAPIHRSIGSYYAGLTFDRVLPRVIFLITIVGLALIVGDTVLDISIWFTGALFISLFITMHFLRTYKIGLNADTASLSRVAKPWLNQLGPFFFGATISALNARFPILIVSYFFLPAELGMVVLMLTFLTLITIPTATLNLVLGPNIRRKIAADPSNSSLRVQYASLAALLAAVSSLIVALVYPWFVEAENQLPISTLMLFAISLIISAICNAIIFFQFQAGSRYILNYIAATVFGVRIVLGLYGLNTHGLYGLGVTQITSSFIFVLLLYVFVVRKPI